jgi:hypothetical protein
MMIEQKGRLKMHLVTLGLHFASMGQQILQMDVVCCRLALEEQGGSCLHVACVGVLIEPMRLPGFKNKVECKVQNQVIGE